MRHAARQGSGRNTPTYQRGVLPPKTLDKNTLEQMSKQHIIPSLTKLLHDPADSSLPIKTVHVCVQTIWTFNRELPFNVFTYLMTNQRDELKKQSMKRALLVCVQNLQALRTNQNSDREFRREVARFAAEVAAMSAPSARSMSW